jgi:hypothetical protein
MVPQFVTFPALCQSPLMAAVDSKKATFTELDLCSSSQIARVLECGIISHGFSGFI